MWGNSRELGKHGFVVSSIPATTELWTHWYTLTLFPCHNGIYFHDRNLPASNSYMHNVFESKPHPQWGHGAPTSTLPWRELAKRRLMCGPCGVFDNQTTTRCWAILLMQRQQQGFTLPSSKVSYSFTSSLSLDTGPAWGTWALSDTLLSVCFHNERTTLRMSSFQSSSGCSPYLRNQPLKWKSVLWKKETAHSSTN